MSEEQIIILIVGLGLSWSIVAFLLIAMFLGKKADKKRQDSYQSREVENDESE